MQYGFPPTNCFVSSAPGDQEPDAQWRLVRADKNKPQAFIIVSDGVVGVRVHFNSGRTVPHLRENCKACEDGKREEWKGYVAALRAVDRLPVIMEFTAVAYDPIAAALKTYGSLRNVRVILSRVKPNDNARVRTVVTGLNPEGITLPDPPDVWNVLCRIWGLLPKERPKESEFQPEQLSPKERDDILQGRAPSNIDDEWTNGTIRRGRRRGADDGGGRRAA